MRRRYALILLPLVVALAFPLHAQTDVEYIIQYDDGNTVYYSGRPQPFDTCGVWFEPPTECQILAGQFQFNSNMGGEAKVYIWYMADGFDPDNYFDSGEPNGSPGLSPLGEVLAGPILYDFNNSGDWQEIVFADFGYPPEDLDVGTDPFYIGYVLLGTGSQPFYPSILGDAGDDRPYHSLAWLTDPSGFYPGESGWWAYGIDWMLRAKVDLYGDPLPVIEDLVDPPDTYQEGPYSITATITDMDSTGVPGSGQVTEARLIYSVDGGDEITVIMTHIGGDTYEGSIPAVGVNQLINFRVEADDNVGHSSVAPNLAGYNFTFRQPSGATVLLVNDSGGLEGEDIYRSALENNGYSYDYWYISPGSPGDDMGYPGSDVINTGIYRSIIWFTGTAHPGSLPDNDADLTTDPVANFMDDGGNFFLSSSDYLGAAFNPDDWDDFMAIPGTFMYEYLKVEDGWSDSHTNPVTGESMDTLYFGIEGDPISGAYTAGFYNHPDPNYNDYCNPIFGVAETCFETEIDNESAGIRYNATYKMVFLPWVLEACDDPDVAEEILLNVLRYFSEGPGPSITMLEGSRYGIYDTQPHNIIVYVTDPGGVNSVSIKFRWDGNPWQTNTMIQVGSHHYSYSFTPPATWSTLEYSIIASNNIGGVGVGPIYECWTTGLQYAGTADFLFCSDQPYAWYVGNFENRVTDRLDELGVDYQMWDVAECGTPDFWTVLNCYDHCFWVGYCDWNLSFPMDTEDNPFSLFLTNGKNLLFSSEEMMGVWTNWDDMSFETGQFAYDWLQIDSLINDDCYTTISLSVPPDSVCQGMISPIQLQTLYFDPMGDLIIPIDLTSPTLFYASSLWCGIRDDEPDHNMIVLSFCLFQMPQDQLDIFIANVLDYFAQGSSPTFTVELVPISYPIQIPASGGSFEFYAFATNNGSNPQIVDLWSEAVLPDGSVVGPLMGPASPTLDPGTTGWYRVQNVPGNAPPGYYSYNGYAGIYPDLIWASDVIEFEKLETGDGPGVDNWCNWGDPIGDEVIVNNIDLPTEFALHPAYPNPFNPITTLSYDLPENAKVSLKVYNLQGRLVATLVDGMRDAGTHEVTFDASHLASGIYLYNLTAGNYTASGKMVMVK